MQQDYVEVGYVRKTHGVAGAVKIFVEEEYLEDALQADLFLIEQKGQVLPFFVKEKQLAADMLIVQFEDISTREQAQPLANSTLFLRQSDILEEEEREMEVFEPEYAHLDGFLLSDQTLGEIGEIAEIVELPHQEYALVFFEGEERMIPLNEQLVVKIDENAKTVLLDLPEGLLEL